MSGGLTTLDMVSKIEVGVFGWRRLRGLRAGVALQVQQVAEKVLGKTRTWAKAQVYRARVSAKR